MSPSLVVVGSCMTDLVSYVDQIPSPGETLHGESFAVGFGGKGANQCIIASRLGAQTAMVGRVGNDSFGKDYIQNFDDHKVDRKYVHKTDGVSTGAASILVDKKGENIIVIVAGANLKMTPKDVQEAENLIKQSKIVLCQGEICEPATIEALQLARKYGVKTLMNAAPASPDMDEKIYSLSDIFCVNETEAQVLSSIPVKTIRDAEDACKTFLKKGCREVIITLGGQGLVYGTHSGMQHIPAHKIDKVVDTTGAGDAFIGALGFLLVYRPELSREQMLSKASQIAAIAIQGRGTQTSFPYYEDVKHIL